MKTSRLFPKQLEDKCGDLRLGMQRISLARRETNVSLEENLYNPVNMYLYSHKLNLAVS